MSTATTPRGIQFAANDFIDVTVNADVPIGKNKYKRVTFDARFERATPEELTDLSKNNFGKTGGNMIDFAREKLISTTGLVDFEKNSADVIEAHEGDDDSQRAHSESLERFLATQPLPQEATLAFIRNQGKSKN